MTLELVAIFKQKQMTFVGLASCSLGAAGGKVVADYISVSKSLTKIAPGAVVAGDRSGGRLVGGIHGGAGSRALPRSDLRR